MNDTKKYLPNDRDRSKCDANREKSIHNLRKKILHFRIGNLRPIQGIEWHVWRTMMAKHKHLILQWNEVHILIVKLSDLKKKNEILKKLTQNGY